MCARARVVGTLPFDTETTDVLGHAGECVKWLIMHARSRRVHSQKNSLLLGHADDALPRVARAAAPPPRAGGMLSNTSGRD